MSASAAAGARPAPRQVRAPIPHACRCGEREQTESHERRPERGRGVGHQHVTGRLPFEQRAYHARGAEPGPQRVLRYPYERCRLGLKDQPGLGPGEREEVLREVVRVPPIPVGGAGQEADLLGQRVQPGHPAKPVDEREQHEDPAPARAAEARHPCEREEKAAKAPGERCHRSPTDPEEFAEHPRRQVIREVVAQDRVAAGGAAVGDRPAPGDEIVEDEVVFEVVPRLDVEFADAAGDRPEYGEPAD